MDKFAEFYSKVMADESAKAELAAVLGDKKINELSDEELAKVGKIGEKLGVSISVEEAKAYFAAQDGEISDDDLDKVAGGSVYYHYSDYEKYFKDPSKDPSVSYSKKR